MRLSVPLLCAALTFSISPLAPSLRATPLEAHEALLAENYPAALAFAKAAVAEEATPFTWYFLGVAQLKTGDTTAAKKSLAELTRIDSANPRTLSLRGEIAFAESRFPDAVTAFDQLLAINTDDAKAFALRGIAKATGKLGDLGAADLAHALELDETQTDALLFRADSLARKGLLATAAADLSRVLQAVPDHRGARPARAMYYLNLNLRQLALRDIETAIEQSPENKSFLGLKKQIEALPEIAPDKAAENVTQQLQHSAKAIYEHDEPGAEYSFQRALLTAQNSAPDAAIEPDLYVRRGDLLLAFGKPDLAKDDYRNARYSGDLIPAASLRLARLDFADKKYDDVIELVHAIDPSLDHAATAEALVLAARSHLAIAQEKKDAAELPPGFEALKIARRLNPDLPDIAAAQNELAAARRALTPAATDQYSGAHLPAALAKAHDLAKQDRFDAARALYDRLLQLNPANPAVYEARLATVAQFGMNDPRAATLETIATELRALAPTLPTTGTPDELALARANLAVHERPYLSRPYIARARLRAARANAAYTAGKPAHTTELTAALNDARLAVQLDAYDPQAHAALAEALIVQKRATDSLQFSSRDEILTQAFASANRALALAPDDTNLLIWRGDLERDQGLEILQRDSRALRFYARAIRSDPRSTRALYAHAAAAFKSNNNAAAIADYRKVLSLEPDNLYARYELGVAQLYAKTYTDAVATFSGLQQTLTASGDETSADAIETQQLHAIALAAAGDDRSEALAKDVLTHSEWIGNADAALENLTQLAIHTPQLDRLSKLPGTPNPALPKTRANQRETSLDAAPR